MKTHEAQHYCRRENAREAGWGRERVVLIKSLITQDRKEQETLLRRDCKGSS